MAKRIFLLRHARKESGSGDLGLSLAGKKQAENLAQKLKNEIGDSENVLILTSSACRARETADIINSVLLSEFGTQELISEEKLWSDASHPYDFDWLKGEISNFKGDNLVIVSHLEYVNQFPYMLGYPENDASYAEGVMIKDGVCSLFG
jgi:phosphohistidine phosphatase SixA